MGLAACDDDKVALGHAELSSLFEREGSGATTEIMEQRVWARWQCQIPWMAELEVEEQIPAQADAIENLGEDVHPPDVNTTDDQTQYSDDRGLTSDNSTSYFTSRRANTSRGKPFRKTADGTAATLPKHLPIPPTRVIRHLNRSDQCEIF
jgi:hypothetical protein